VHASRHHIEPNATSRGKFAPLAGAVLATLLLFTCPASAVETLRVGRAVPQAFSFVPVDTW